MSKSASEKFAEYLAESREISAAVNDFVDSSFENYKNYAHVAGALSGIVKELIRELPKAKRESMRDRFHTMAKNQKNEYLVKILKESK